MQQGKTQSVSHHCLIRAIIERELTRQHLGTWDDFVKLKIVGPQRGGPKGKGVHTQDYEKENSTFREKVIAHNYKIIGTTN